MNKSTHTFLFSLLTPRGAVLAISSVLSLMLLHSCGQDRSGEFYALTAQNTWIYDEMKANYLWGEYIIEPNYKKFFGSGSTFFSNLVKDTKSDDKWSYIIVDSIISDPHSRNYFNHYDSYGLELSTMTDPTGRTSRSFARIMNVLEGSPAAEAGLMRGDFISMVDSQTVTSSIITKSLVSGEPHNVHYHHLGIDTTSFYWIDTICTTLPASRYVEDKAFPVSKIIYDRQSGLSIGYILCSRLIDAPTGESATSDYKATLAAVMSYFKQENIDDIIIDFRNCNYGTLEMASYLASCIVPSDKIGTPFMTTVYRIDNSSNNKTYNYLPEAAPANLGLSRVFLITSSQTQGASEWFIHGINATLGEDNVHIVGYPTAGMRYFTDFVAENYGHKLYPIVAKLENSNSEKDFSSFSPDNSSLFHVENEFVQLSTYGNTSEPLLYYTIEYITGRDTIQDTSAPTRRISSHLIR